MPVSIYTCGKIEAWLQWLCTQTASSGDHLVATDASGNNPAHAPRNVAAWDRYADVENNPLRYTDPSGHRVAHPPHQVIRPL